MAYWLRELDVTWPTMVQTVVPALAPVARKTHTVSTLAAPKSQQDGEVRWGWGVTVLHWEVLSLL